MPNGITIACFQRYSANDPQRMADLLEDMMKTMERQAFGIVDDVFWGLIDGLSVLMDVGYVRAAEGGGQGSAGQGGAKRRAQHGSRESERAVHRHTAAVGRALCADNHLPATSAIEATSTNREGAHLMAYSQETAPCLPTPS